MLSLQIECASKRCADLPRTLALASVMAYKYGREGYMMKIVATARKTGT